MSRGGKGVEQEGDGEEEGMERKETKTSSLPSHLALKIPAGSSQEGVTVSGKDI